MSTSLSYSQALMVAEIRCGSPDSSRVKELEQVILYHPELQRQVLEHVRNSNRDIPTLAFDPNHSPGILRIVKIPKGTKVRLTYSPADRDYLQSLYWYRGIILPITEGHLCEYTHAYRPKRGIKTEIRQILSAVTAGHGHQIIIGQDDIKSCFDNAPIALIHHLLPPHTRNQVLMLQQRYRETTLSRGMRPNGGPQGHPAICALINLTLDHLLAPVRQRYEGGTLLSNFSDDLAFVGPNDEVQQMRKEVQTALNSHGVTLNPDKNRTTHVGPGAKTVILGLELEWTTSDPWPIIRPKRQAYQNLSDKIAEATHTKHIQAILSGWKAHYGLCNDTEHPRRTQQAVVEGYRRYSAGIPQPPRPDKGGIQN